MKYNKIGSVPYTHMTSVSYPRTRYAINENRPAEAQWASACLSSPSLIIQLLTMVMKHDHIRGADYLGHQQSGPAPSFNT